MSTSGGLTSNFASALRRRSIPDGSSEVRVRDAAEAPWRTLVRLSAGGKRLSLGFSADGRELKLAGDHDADTMRLLVIELATGAQRVLAEETGSDLRRSYGASGHAQNSGSPF